MELCSCRLPEPLPAPWLSGGAGKRRACEWVWW